MKMGSKDLRLDEGIVPSEEEEHPAKKYLSEEVWQKYKKYKKKQKEGGGNGD